MHYENLVFFIIIITITILFGFSRRISSRILGIPRDAETLMIIITACFAGKFLWFWWGLILTIFIIFHYDIKADNEDNEMSFIYRCFWKKFVVYWLIGNIFYFLIHHNQLLPISEELKIIGVHLIKIWAKLGDLIIYSFNHISFLR